MDALLIMDIFWIASGNRNKYLSIFNVKVNFHSIHADT